MTTIQSDSTVRMLWTIVRAAPPRLVHQRCLGASEDDCLADQMTENNIRHANHRAYVKYFERWGCTFPVDTQKAKPATAHQSKEASVLEALLFNENRFVILMGLQDADTIKGEPRLGLAGPNDCIDGPRGHFACAQGEPVVLDQAGVIASVLRGPSTRIRVHRRSSQLACIAFWITGVSFESTTRAIHSLSTMVADDSIMPSLNITEI